MNWSQIRTVLWLRWRLTRNQWSRGGQLNAVLTLIAVAIGVFIGAVGAVVGVVVGVLAFQQSPPFVLLMVWDGLSCAFLFFWVMGVLAELQRSEAIDLGRLLHLPVSLQGIFVVNYLGSHLSLSVILFLPGMLGLCLGLAVSKGPAMLWLIPLVLSVIFMITAWTYCLRGWLISLMVNQRRRRTVLVIVTVGIMVVAQLPNIYVNIIGHHSGPRPPPLPGGSQPVQTVTDPRAQHPAFLAAHNYVPILWPGNGAMALGESNPWPAISGALCAFVLGALGLQRAYTSTLRFYQGQEKARPAKPKAALKPAAAAPKSTWVEKTLPGVPEETSTLALAFLRSFTRAPEMKMALGMNFFMLFVLAGTFFVQGVKSPPEPPYKPFAATAAVAFQFMGLLQSMFNQFGFDRDGFRALVLLPTRRKYMLLAKNLAFLPLAAGVTIIFLGILTVLVRLPALDLLATGCQFVFGFLLLSGLGNLMSIMFPYRIGIGSLKPTKMPGKTKAMLIVSHACFPLLMIPLFIPVVVAFAGSQLGGWPGPAVNLLCSVVLAAAAACLYWFSLEGLAALLQRREKDILQVVTTEVE